MKFMEWLLHKKDLDSIRSGFPYFQKGKRAILVMSLIGSKLIFLEVLIAVFICETLEFCKTSFGE